MNNKKKFEIINHTILASLGLIVGFGNIILNYNTIKEYPFWALIVLTLIAIGGYNLGALIGKLNNKNY